jgi:hypothetical protein
MLYFQDFVKRFLRIFLFFVVLGREIGQCAVCLRGFVLFFMAGVPPYKGGAVARLRNSLEESLEAAP